MIRSDVVSRHAGDVAVQVLAGQGGQREIVVGDQFLLQPVLDSLVLVSVGLEILVPASSRCCHL